MTPSRLGGEAVGTAVLVAFTGILLSVYTTAPSGLGYQDFTGIGIAQGLVLALLVAGLGVHTNPAVTLAFVAAGRLRPAPALKLVVAQIFGAIVGALFVWLVLSDEGAAVDFGAAVPRVERVGDGAMAVLALEALGAFVLVHAFLSDKGPIVIGGALAAAFITLGPLTGGALNPARAFGPALVGDGFGDTTTFVVGYVLGPLVGALAAAGTQRLVE